MVLFTVRTIKKVDDVITLRLEDQNSNFKTLKLQKSELSQKIWLWDEIYCDRDYFYQLDKYFWTPKENNYLAAEYAGKEKIRLYEIDDSIADSKTSSISSK